MGFSIEDKWVKRAGLDYWDKLEVTTYESYPDFLCKNFPGDQSDARIYMASTKAKRTYCDVEYERDTGGDTHRS